MKNADQAAFARPKSGDTAYAQQGLTKREYFAGLAMQGILARRFDKPKEEIKGTISDAIEYADELLKQLEK